MVFTLWRDWKFWKKWLVFLRRTSWKHLETSAASLTSHWNLLFWFTVTLNIGTIPAGSGSTGTFSCLWGLCCSSLPAPDHFHMGWKPSTYSAPHHKWLLINERETGNERQKEADKEKFVWGGRVSEAESYKLSKKKKQKKEAENWRHGCRARKRKDADGAGMLSRAPLSWAPSFRPGPAALLSPRIPLFLSSSLAFIFTARTPPGFHAHAWEILL